MRLLILLLATTWGLLAPGGAATQAPAAVEGWNGERALELVRRAQERRAETHADTGLVNYQSDARLYVYFYLDRGDTGERNLVKTDQLALEVFWQAPDQVKQRIVGWRDDKSLPTNIRYHLDHLTVVQENFGDEILLGDGDEVRGVLHPAAPRAEAFYEYRLVDSLTLRLPGAEEPVRVFELQVRPRDTSVPAMLGSLFVERRAGDIVRMDFTFTAASYVDRFLDYINISLDNGLWQGRFWLPNQQRVEIRRRIPELDVPAGSVIRANVRVGNYRFNEPLAPGLFLGPPVVAAPRTVREAFPFEEDLYAELREQGLSPEMELRDIRRIASELVRERALSQMTGLRLRLPGASEVLRYNRAEGLVLGAGASYVPTPSLRATAQGAWAFGPGQPSLDLHLDARRGGTWSRASLYRNRPTDVGGVQAASGFLNTASAFLAGRDFRDLYYADGTRVEVRHRLARNWHLLGDLRGESHASATLTGDAPLGGGFRSVQPVDDAGLFLRAGLGLQRSAPFGLARWWEGELLLGGGSARLDLEGANPRLDFVRPELTLAAGTRLAPAAAELSIQARGGMAFGEIPRQELFLVGGRGTVPGYEFRRFGGDRFVALNAVAAADLWHPWVRGRALGALGWSGVGGPGERAARLWGATPTAGVLPSLGLGVGLVHDVLRLDLARGLARQGRWELIIEATPAFWDFL
jgi:hypothetical protein